MIDPSDLEHLARAVAYRAAMAGAAPGRAQAALRVSIMAEPPAITDAVAEAYRRIMAQGVDDMPPSADDLSLLIDTIAMRHGLQSRAEAWRIVGINPDRGRDLLTRSASAIDWPIWFACQHAAIGLMAAPELLDLAYQYLNDMQHPPAPDSRERRVEWIKKVIAKAGAGKQ